MTDVRVSLVIPAYNAAHYIAETLQSALAQTHPVSEIIVVNDGSTDETARIVQGFTDRGVPLVCYDQANRGMTGARNAGLERTTGDYVAFLDADDLWFAHKTATQLQAFSSDPSLEIVSGQVEQFLSPDVPRLEERVRLPDSPMGGYFIGAMLIRRTVFGRVGLFDDAYRSGDWIAWVARARHLGIRMLERPEVVTRRRIHEHNFSRTSPEARTGMLAVMRDHLRAKKREGS